MANLDYLLKSAGVVDLKASGTGKSRNCVKGYSCGSSCIAKNRVCKNSIKSDTGKAAAETLKSGVKGESKKKEETKEELKKVNKKPELPPGTSVTKTKQKITYSAKIPGTSEKLNFRIDYEGDDFDGPKKEDGLVDFDISGGFNKGALDGRSAIKAALLARRMMDADVASRKDGYIYGTSAWTADGAGESRASAYTKFGFSKPNKPGDMQYAIVKNGKLEPYYP